MLNIPKANRDSFLDAINLNQKVSSSVTSNELAISCQSLKYIFARTIGMNVIPVDLKHQLAKPDSGKMKIKVRNEAMVEVVNQKDKGGLMIVGQNHLVGVLTKEDGIGQIDSTRYHILPLLCSEISQIEQPSIDSDIEQGKIKVNTIDWREVCAKSLTTPVNIDHNALKEACSQNGVGFVLDGVCHFIGKPDLNPSQELQIEKPQIVCDLLTWAILKNEVEIIERIYKEFVNVDFNDKASAKLEKEEYSFLTLAALESESSTLQKMIDLDENALLGQKQDSTPISYILPALPNQSLANKYYDSIIQHGQGDMDLLALAIAITSSVNIEMNAYKVLDAFLQVNPKINTLAPIEDKPFYGETLFTYAIKQRSPVFMKAMIDRRPELRVIKNHDGLSPKAICEMYGMMVEYIILSIASSEPVELLSDCIGALPEEYLLDMFAFILESVEIEKFPSLIKHVEYLSSIEPDDEQYQNKCQLARQAIEKANTLQKKSKKKPDQRISLEWLAKIIVDSYSNTELDVKSVMRNFIGDHLFFDFSQQINTSPFYGETIFTYAIKNKGLQFVEILLEIEPELLFKENAKGDLPFEIAAQVQVVDELIMPLLSFVPINELLFLLLSKGADDKWQALFDKISTMMSGDDLAEVMEDIQIRNKDEVNPIVKKRMTHLLQQQINKASQEGRKETVSETKNSERQILQQYQRQSHQNEESESLEQTAKSKKTPSKKNQDGLH